MGEDKSDYIGKTIGSDTQEVQSIKDTPKIENVVSIVSLVLDQSGLKDYRVYLDNIEEFGGMIISADESWSIEITSLKAQASADNPNVSNPTPNTRLGMSVVSLLEIEDKDSPKRKKIISDNEDIIEIRVAFADFSHIQS
ncbi:MAG: hypothetical protein Q9M91_06055 [Candidatus Dojkabacteria bacterium]|nr:hypothetical protein [Candidatus Dojkabacteria bacterium]